MQNGSLKVTENSTQSKTYLSIGIIGAGAWGTALAVIAAKSGRDVVLWARESDVVDSINTRHENEPYLRGVSLSPRISATRELAETARCEALLVSAPAQHVRHTLEMIAPVLETAKPVALCAKGIEKETGKLVTEVLAEVLSACAPAILSGPSFAADVARGLPTAVAIAGEKSTVARLQASLASPSFRPYGSDDLTGVALGGAAKNVYAIACGIVDGLGLGESACAALLARGFAELVRLGEALGARRETLMGLSGLGDLVLTATSATSRNFALGRELGRGRTLSVLTARGQPLAEGVDTAPALVKRGRALAVELPIAEATAAILSGALELGAAVRHLMSRPLTSE
jgi:glycerol-3-phosphate dehydrogenase (NAD(P)+)